MAAPDPDSDEFTVSTDETIHMEARRLGIFAFTALILTLGGLTVGCFYAWRLEGELFGLIGVVVFLGFGFAAIYLRIKQNREGSAGSFILSPEGISVPSLKGQLIPWSEISDISMMIVRGAKFVNLVLTDKAQDDIGRSSVMKGMSKFGENVGIKGDVSIAASQLPIALGEFLIMLLAFAADHGKHPWATEMLEELVKMQDETTPA